MPNTSKTEASENERNARIANMTPMMAALASQTEQWLSLQASAAMWRELDRAVKS
jgi:hypothetical protein